MVFHKNRLSIFLVVCALLGLEAVATPAVEAAVITVINNDNPGEGFNDPTPVAPVGGNTGTTLGQQRLIAFQHAANIWAGLISSAVTIRVSATFDPLFCNATTAVLGSAGPVGVARDFSGAPHPATWYPYALANALRGSDLDSGNDDISATFNSAIGTTCPFPNVWYYGLNASPPGSQVDFVSVVVHELGHGLGFLTFVDLTAGAKFMGFDDTFMLNLERHGASPPDYPSMTNAQRVAASTDTGNLHWVGSNVEESSGVLTAGTVGTHVQMFASNPQQPGSSVSHWDTALTPNQIMEPVYTEPLHDPVLELPLLQDIGWTLLTTPPPSADTLPPVITISATPEILWPPAGKLVPVTVSGMITDPESGVDASTAAYTVTDEYGRIQPSGLVTVGSDGSYAFTVSLRAWWKRNDKDGRQYIITVSAQDNVGNKGSASTGVTVPRD